MAVSDVVPIIAAFVLLVCPNVFLALLMFYSGILFQAAAGVFLIYFNGHAATIFQDGRRLVLLLFLLFAALWAQIDFINLLIPTKSTTACQVTLVFSTASDQLARVGIEQFLLWSVGNSSKATAERLIMQAMLGLRFVAGALLVGFTRPEFAPACVAHTSISPISIVVIALDFIIIGVLIIRALAFGVFRDFQEIRSSTHQQQSKALILSVVGFLVWTGSSVVMLLGISSTLLILRTTLPSIGLFTLVGVLAIFPGALLSPKEEQLTTPEASSPFVTPSPPSRDLFRGNVGNGSPVSGHNYTKSGSLFVVNPSATPRDSPTTFQNNQSDVRGIAKFGGEITVRGMGPSEPDQLGSRNGPGYRGSSGVFPSILAASSMSSNQGTFAPQIRPSGGERSLPSFPPPASQSQQKRSLFNWSKQVPQPTVRSLGISKPVMSDSVDPALRPFARMQTIDLETAAINERERREGAAARSRLVANRPAPHPPALAPQEALRKSISVKRKEMPNRIQAVMPTIPSSGASGLSVDVANGSTTSASLSPGREEVRRRSPRNPNSFDQLFSEKALSKPSLQGKQTLGLPSNPRSQRITMAKEAGMAKEQTVMFMNDIVYDDPGIVKTIINGAPDIYAAAKRTKTLEKSPTGSYAATLKSSNSIIHRPRPYRRDSEKDRALFPSEPSPRHKRSKSGSSILTRKSILMSHPGSPTQLPPLPPPPTTAAKLTRLLPNNTKSMTFDEKIELLFPAPPGSSLVHHRRSSVPSLPRLPSVFMSDTPNAQSPIEEDEQSRRASKRTTIASFGFQDFQIPANGTKDNEIAISDRQTYRFSANTYRTLADEVGETWIPGIPSIEANVRKSVQEHPLRDSNTYDMKPAFTDTSSSDESSHDDSTTYWGSIHSEIPPVDLSKVMRGAKTTFIQRPEQSASSRALPPVPKNDKSGGEEIMTIMLDSEEKRSPASDNNRRSFFLDANQSLPGDATPTPRGVMAWHRRIGDDLPTFSERKQNTRSRKMPPPTPLLLNSKGRNATVVVRAPEPSPIDSPERAIKEIQAQLRRFEEPSRGSVGSMLRHIPDSTNVSDDKDNHDDRFKLLENLEKEMGQQENQWQRMQTNLDRDSMSAIMTPPAPPETNLSPESYQRSSRTPPQIVSRRARVRSSMTIRSKGQDSTSTSSTQSSDNSRASVWQQRLAEAQMEYLENAPALLRKRSVNFLSVAKAQLGSPTPPDSVDSGTDYEYELEIDSSSDNEQSSNFEAAKPPCLWQPALISPKAAVGRMWNPPYEVTAPVISSDPPAKNIRPKRRLNLSALPSLSGRLWSRPASYTNSRAVVGLWSSRLVRSKSIVTRRVTQRPQRKSKRVTFLPNIIESPQPLPNKRDTLGIFQFPWGETSDSAVYQPIFDPALLSGPINAKLEARSRELEPEATEYSSSFFDDYDEEPDEDEDPESDDDFDETTLWEIASLLKSKDVPSKNSLLPPPREIIEDYDNESDFESDSETRFPPSAMGPIQQLQTQPLATTSKDESKLWASDLSSAFAAVATGLPQPDVQVWQAYMPDQVDVVRTKTQSSGSLATLASRDLWATPKSGSPIKNTFPLWNETPAAKEVIMDTIVQPKGMWLPRPQAVVEARTSGLFITDITRSVIRRTEAVPANTEMVKARRSSPVRSLTVSSQSLWSPEGESPQVTEWITKSTLSPTTNLMWAPAPAIEDVAAIGLFDKSVQRLKFRTTDLLPAAINIIRRPQTLQAPLSRLISRELWNGSKNLQAEHHWISESSVRPESPSVYSEVSSGESSPSSDASSVKSNSTKASSLWGSIRSTTVPAWWDSKSAKRPTNPSPDSSANVPSNPPMGQPSSKPLSPVRESRMLAPRDLWESMAPTLDPPVRKIRKPTAQTLAKALHQPLRHQHRVVVAFRGDWDEALAEAIEASKPRKMLICSIASKADWEAALSLAISQSQPRLQRPKCTPSDWNAALDEATSKFSAPKIATIEHYNVSVRHPVFFTSNLATTTHDIHPAASGYTAETRVVQTINTGMWSGPSIAASPQEAGVGSMWSKASSLSLPNRFTHIKGEYIKKVLPSRPVPLPRLNSNKLFRPIPTPKPENHWIHEASRRATTQVKTWVPSPGKEVEADAAMWASAKNIAPQPLTGMLVQLKGKYIKKAPSRPAGLPQLDSCELFGSASSNSSQIHWLDATSSRSKSNSVALSRTWTAPVSGVFEQQSTKMWKFQSVSMTPSPTLFSNPHSEPWSRKKRESTRITEIENTGMWRRSTTMPTSPNNWLVKRRSSRVEFRY